MAVLTNTLALIPRDMVTSFIACAKPVKPPAIAVLVVLRFKVRQDKVHKQRRECTVEYCAVSQELN